MSVIVSVHVPKCAGTALLDWLVTAYGDANIVRDYQDRPLDPSAVMNIDPVRFLENSAVSLDGLAGHQVVHGHFWAKKYESIDDARFITFLREPITRSLSQFLHWKQSARTANVLQNYVQDHVDSWTDFLRLPLVRSTYRNVFFRDFDMNRFDFIGNSDATTEEIARLGTMLGFDHRLTHVNVAPQAHSEEAGNVLADGASMAIARDCLADEITFYERHTGR